MQIYKHHYSSPGALEMINSADYSDAILKRLHNPVYETTPAKFSPIGNIPQTGHSEGTEPTYEPIQLTSSHPNKGSRNSANGERTSSGKASSCSDMYISQNLN